MSLKELGIESFNIFDVGANTIICLSTTEGQPIVKERASIILEQLSSSNPKELWRREKVILLNAKDITDYVLIRLN
ncbi:hypothetical protein NKR74_06275 [Bacillus sp. 3103sda1]|uniref:hypothetical protein n=1 Tax=Bacillus sp. 3103sda1 TaxID=2953808 RepID=UPI00209E8257|nr:hypothetical protein [Bacillus sp. 3103sda1]MCP1122943.1 hypothetical protein [Bacillus sp. 3103sda1]